MLSEFVQGDRDGHLVRRTENIESHQVIHAQRRGDLPGVVPGPQRALHRFPVSYVYVMQAGELGGKRVHRAIGEVLD